MWIVCSDNNNVAHTFISRQKAIEFCTHKSEYVFQVPADRLYPVRIEEEIQSILGEARQILIEVGMDEEEARRALGIRAKNA